MIPKVLLNNISIMDICDCCYEHSNTSTTCNFGHKICIECTEKLDYDMCLFCNPLQNKKINLRHLEHLNGVAYPQDFIFTYRLIVFSYLLFFIILCFYVDGFIWMLLDVFYHFIFQNHELIYNGISFYFPTLFQCICGFFSKFLLFFSYITYTLQYEENQYYYAYNYLEP